MLLCAWSSGTLAGNLLGSFINQPEKYTLDFAFTAVFAALTLSLFRGKGDVVPWGVSIVLALICEKILPGKWYIVIGGIGGAIVSALINHKSKLN